jgi:hypothetical protein
MKTLDGILSILEGVVLYFKLCSVLGIREFYPNSNTKKDEIKDQL